MIKIARLNIKGKGENMEKVLKAAMKKAGVSMADIEVKCDNKYSNNTHFGNWCFTPVLDNEASAKVATVMGQNLLDNRRSILEGADIALFKEGDKVKVSFIGGVGIGIKSSGKVLRARPPIKTQDYSCEGELAVLKKGSSSKGWIFKPGDQVCIEKI
jgi:hypothetical protein